MVEITDKCAEDIANVNSLEWGNFSDWARSAVKVYEQAFDQVEDVALYAIDNSTKFYNFLKFRLSSYEEAILEIDNDMCHFSKIDRERTQACITELKFLIKMYELYVGEP